MNTPPDIKPHHAAMMMIFIDKTTMVVTSFAFISRRDTTSFVRDLLGFVGEEYGPMKRDEFESVERR